MVFCRLFEHNKQKYGVNKTTSPWQRYQGLVVCLLSIMLSLYVSGFRLRLRGPSDVVSNKTGNGIMI